MSNKHNIPKTDLSHLDETKVIRGKERELEGFIKLCEEFDKVVKISDHPLFKNERYSEMYNTGIESLFKEVCCAGSVYFDYYEEEMDRYRKRKNNGS